MIQLYSITIFTIYSFNELRIVAIVGMYFIKSIWVLRRLLEFISIWFKEWYMHTFISVVKKVCVWQGSDKLSTSEALSITVGQAISCRHESRNMSISVKCNHQSWSGKEKLIKTERPALTPRTLNLSIWRSIKCERVCNEASNLLELEVEGRECMQCMPATNKAHTLGSMENICKETKGIDCFL